MELQARFFPFIDLLSVLAKIITLGVGASRFHSGTLSDGVLVAFLLYLDQFFAPMRQLSTVFDQWMQAQVAATQLRELCCRRRRPPRRPSIRSLRRGCVGRSAWTTSPSPTSPPAWWRWTTSGLTIPPGQVVALVGTTGAGKSTLMKPGRPLLRRDLRHGGHRRHPDPRPGPAGLPPPARVRAPRALSVLRDHPLHIAYGRPEASDLEVERAAREVGAHEFIGTLPQGYHTPVSEQGKSLSAGERPAAQPRPSASWSTRPSCCSTKPPPTSTWPPKHASSAPWAWSPAAVRPS